LTRLLAVQKWDHDRVSCSYDYECCPSWECHSKEHCYYDDYHGEGHEGKNDNEGRGGHEGEGEGRKNDNEGRGGHEGEGEGRHRGGGGDHEGSGGHEGEGEGRHSGGGSGGSSSSGGGSSYGR
jgi:hypothetical protein